MPGHAPKISREEKKGLIRRKKRKFPEAMPYDTLEAGAERSRAFRRGENPYIRRQPVPEEQEMVQPKLEVMAPEDEKEKEAEQAEEQVVQRQMAETTGPEAEEGSESGIQRKESKPEIQAKSEGPDINPKELKPKPKVNPIQTKLEIGTPDDQYEKEADDTADKVMRMKEPIFAGGGEGVDGEDENNDAPNIQMKLGGGILMRKTCPTCGSEMSGGECPCDQTVQRKAGNEEEEGLLMRKGKGGKLETTPKFHSTLASTKGNGSPLPDRTRSFMEGRMGNDFSGVRVHTGAGADKLARGINSRAFTHGSDIYFKNGEWSPDSDGGKKLLAHELTHTVQQGGGVKAKVMRQEEENGEEHVKISDPVPGKSYLLVPGKGEAVLNTMEVTERGVILRNKTQTLRFAHTTTVYLKRLHRTKYPSLDTFEFQLWVSRTENRHLFRRKSFTKFFAVKRNQLEAAGLYFANFIPIEGGEIFGYEEVSDPRQFAIELGRTIIRYRKRGGARTAIKKLPKLQLKPEDKEAVRREYRKYWTKRASGEYLQLTGNLEEDLIAAFRKDRIAPIEHLTDQYRTAEIRAYAAALRVISYPNTIKVGDVLPKSKYHDSELHLSSDRESPAAKGAKTTFKMSFFVDKFRNDLPPEFEVVAWVIWSRKKKNPDIFFPEDRLRQYDRKTLENPAKRIRLKNTQEYTFDRTGDHNIYAIVRLWDPSIQKHSTPKGNSLFDMLNSPRESGHVVLRLRQEVVHQDEKTDPQLKEMLKQDRPSSGGRYLASLVMTTQAEKRKYGNNERSGLKQTEGRNPEFFREFGDRAGAFYMGYQLIGPKEGEEYKWYAVALPPFLQSPLRKGQKTQEIPRDPSLGEGPYAKFPAKGKSLGSTTTDTAAVFKFNNGYFKNKVHMAIVCQRYKDGEYLGYEVFHQFFTSSVHDHEAKAWDEHIRELTKVNKFAAKELEKILGVSEKLNAVFISDETGEAVPLHFYFGASRENPKETLIVDLTSPQASKHTFAGKDLEDALKTFDNWEKYPEGKIVVVDPRLPGGRREYETSPTSLAEDISSFHGWVSMGLMIAGAITLIVPGLEGLAPVLFELSMATGVVSLGSNLYFWSQQDDIDYEHVMIDVAFLAGMLLFGGAKLANIKIGKVVKGPGGLLNPANLKKVDQLRKAERFFVISGFTSDVVAGYLIAENAFEQIEAILKSDLPIWERKIALFEALYPLLLHGLFMGMKALMLEQLKAKQFPAPEKPVVTEVKHGGKGKAKQIAGKETYAKESPGKGVKAKGKTSPKVKSKKGAGAEEGPYTDITIREVHDPKLPFAARLNEDMSITINRAKAHDPNVLLEEFAHIWLQLSERMDPKMFKAITKEIVGTEAYNQVAENPFYKAKAEQSQDPVRYLVHETLAQAIRSNGKNLPAKGRGKGTGPIRNFLRDFWEKILDFLRKAGFNIPKKTKSLHGMTAQELVNTAHAELTSGKPISRASSQEILDFLTGKATSIEIESGILSGKGGKAVVKPEAFYAEKGDVPTQGPEPWSRPEIYGQFSEETVKYLFRTAHEAQTKKGNAPLSRAEFEEILSNRSAKDIPSRINEEGRKLLDAIIDDVNMKGYAELEKAFIAEYRSDKKNVGMPNSTLREKFNLKYKVGPKGRLVQNLEGKRKPDFAKPTESETLDIMAQPGLRETVLEYYRNVSRKATFDISEQIKQHEQAKQPVPKELKEARNKSLGETTAISELIGDIRTESQVPGSQGSKMFPVIGEKAGKGTVDLYYRGSDRSSVYESKGGSSDPGLRQIVNIPYKEYYGKISEQLSTQHLMDVAFEMAKSRKPGTKSAGLNLLKDLMEHRVDLYFFAQRFKKGRKIGKFFQEDFGKTEFLKYPIDYAEVDKIFMMMKKDGYLARNYPELLD